MTRAQPPIVILHGWGLSGKTFAPLAAELRRRGYRCFVPDLPGFGQEPAPAYVWRLRDYVRFVEQYLKKHHLARPVFVGHSFGGRVALKYHELHPADLLAMVLTGTPGFTPIPKKRLILFVTLAKLGKLLFATPPFHLWRDEVRKWYYYVVGARDFFRAEGVMREVFKTVVQEELVGSMEKVSVPCLLLWGEYDIVIPLSIARRMHEVIPRAELKVIPQTDHGVPFKQPQVFAEYLIRFLNQL